MAMFDWTNQPIKYNAGTATPNMNMLQSSVSNGGYGSLFNSTQPGINDYITSNFNQSAGIGQDGGFSPMSAFGGTGGGAATGFSGMMGKFGDWANQNQGLIGLGTGLLQGISSIYQGNKAMGLYERQLNNQIQTSERNYQNQRQTVNAQLADRQRARVASNSTGYLGVDEYMKKYGV